jgi:hypothetical protein
LAARFAPVFLFALIVQKLKLPARDGGVHVRRDGHVGAELNLLLALGCLIPAVVPLAF